jgi:mono/diheme cytochrome c family protein
VKRTALIAAIALVFVASVGLSRLPRQNMPQGPEAHASNPAVVQRGEYLVKIMGCNDCHTPWKMGARGPEPDMTRALTGHPSDMVMPPPPANVGPWVWHGAATNTAFAGPWGVSFTANLTPDPETGLGKWTEEMFIATMRTARHQGKGRPILPPMPVKMIGNANDEDLKSIFAYLQSLTPVKNRVPAPIEPSQTSEEKR